MNTRDPRSPNPPDTARPAGAAVSAGTQGRKPATADDHPFLQSSGYVGSLVAGPAKKPPKITHGRHPRGYRRPDDVILADVRERLCDRPDIAAANVRASVVRGVVRLEGEVADELQKRRIEDCVGNVTGVVRIDDQVTVKG